MNDQEFPKVGNFDAAPSKVAEYTADYTEGKTAPARVMHINLWVFKYGTNDKTHGAAVALAIFLLMLITLIYVTGFLSDNTLADKVLSWLGSAFMFVAGVAVGKSGGEDK